MEHLYEKIRVLAHPPLMFQIVSFLALLFYFLSYYLSQTLFDFLPRASGEGAVLLLSMFNVVGYALSVVLCPVLISLQRGSGKKSLAVGVGFIALVTVPQFVVRSLGAVFWFGTPAAIVVLAICLGILFTLAHGLFFLSWNDSHTGKNQRSYRVLFLAFAICVSILARLFSVPLLEISNVASDPPRAIAALVNVIKWFMTLAGLLCAVCFILLKLLTTEKTLEQSQPRIIKTDWVMIARLVGLSVVFSLINAVMETGLYPFMGGIAAKRYTPHTMTVVAAVCLCAFLAGRYSINRFLRWFLPPAIALFILLPCLVLFEEYPGFILLISTLVSIFRFSLWIIFTVAVIECYAPVRGRLLVFRPYVVGPLYRRFIFFGAGYQPGCAFGY
ncbi:MAG: hypothetical protein LBQ93_08525 [Treponema sp.]|jgi:hypothetical protein|nr:hypothetical protein [Treponema sp.]